MLAKTCWLSGFQIFYISSLMINPELKNTRTTDLKTQRIRQVYTYIQSTGIKVNSTVAHSDEEGTKKFSAKGQSCKMVAFLSGWVLEVFIICNYHVYNKERN